jgi:hypothetical protein
LYRRRLLDRCRTARALLEECHNKIHVSLYDLRAVSNHVPGPTYLQVFVPTVHGFCVPSERWQDLRSTTSDVSKGGQNEEHTVSQLGLDFLQRMESVRSLGLRALQQVSKALLLAPGPYVFGLNHGKLLLHRGDGGGPRLLKEHLCRLEHSESGDGRRSRETLLLKLLLCLRLRLCRWRGRRHRRRIRLRSFCHLRVGLNRPLGPHLRSWSARGCS